MNKNLWKISSNNNNDIVHKHKNLTYIKGNEWLKVQNIQNYNQISAKYLICTFIVYLHVLYYFIYGVFYTVLY